MSARAGSTLLELLTTLALLAMIGVACAGLVRSQSLLLRTVGERAAGGEAVRSGLGVLRAELQDLTVGDRYAVAADSIAFRVFRGLGIVCSVSPPYVTVRYRGVRQPDPTKDSLLLVGAEQTATIKSMSARVDPCLVQPADQLIAFEPDLLPPLDAAVLFFESGAYHLASNALRYRRGSSGLQPITDDIIDHTRSHFSTHGRSQALLITLRTSHTAAAFGQQSDARVGMRNR